jgi:integrase
MYRRYAWEKTGEEDGQDDGGIAIRIVERGETSSGGRAIGFAEDHHGGPRGVFGEVTKAEVATMRGDGRVFQRGAKWWIAYYAPKDGRMEEIRESAGDTEAQAQKRLRDRLHAVRNHREGVKVFAGPKQERVGVEQLLQTLETDYAIHQRSSLRRLTSHLVHVRQYFGADLARAITRPRLVNYIQFRQGQGAANATINRELEPLQRAFSLAIENEVLAFMPKFPSLPEENARQVFFERADFETIVSHLTSRNRVDTDLQDFLWWFFYTGMRPKETKALTWAQFDRERERWTLTLERKQAKTKKARKLVLSGELKAILHRRLAARRLNCPLIFHRQGTPVGDFRKVWKRACRVAGFIGGIEGYTPYDCRRTAVRNLTRSGVEESVAMKISGHVTRDVFDRYNITSEDDIEEAMERVTEYVSTLPKTTNTDNHTDNGHVAEIRRLTSA